jgi:hypothetical protein
MAARHDETPPENSKQELQNPGFTKEQRDYASDLKEKYADSLVIVRSIRKKDRAEVNNTAFFVDAHGTIVTTKENLFLPNEKLSDRIITFHRLDGTPYNNQRLISSPTDKNSHISPFIYVWRVDAKSTSIPILSERPADGDLLTGLGVDAGTEDTPPVQGRVKEWPKPDRFTWSVTTMAGSNGSPIFNLSGNAEAIQVSPSVEEPTVQGVPLPVKQLRKLMANK